ncbi:uncharacterized protein ACNLHF_019605 isoform 1-T3 [Anomaloglossus baeobatrachus]|uniref:uncharacterized protein LOC142311087 n=1 Tax=Anomaloglossus baeobatrachus TaxID=238106 RepID=UPI003F50C5A2
MESTSFTSSKRSSKRNPSKSRILEKSHKTSRSSRRRLIGRAKVSPKDETKKKSAPEICPSPPYFQQDDSILQDNQSEHFNDFDIIVKEEVKEEKDVILVTIEEEEVPVNISRVTRRPHRNRKQATSRSICFVERPTAKIPRLRKMQLKVKELISAVRSHPVLWDPSDRGYSDRQKKADAWLSVCCCLYPDWDDLDNRDKGILDNEVRKRWRSARDQFRREIVQGQNGLAPPSKRPYIHLEELMFLIPVLDIRPANLNGVEIDVQVPQEHHLGESEPELPTATAGGASDPSDGGRSLCYEEPPVTGSATLVTQQVLPLQYRERKDKKSSFSSTSADTIDSQVLAYLQRNIEEDSEDAFVRSLGSYIRKVPERWRLWLRSSIQTLIEACIPPNDPEKVLGLIDQVKLACPLNTAPPIEIEFISPLAAYQSPSQPQYCLSTSSQATSNSYSQSPPCISHSFPRLSSYHSHPSTSYTQDSPSQPSYAFHSHRESRRPASFPPSVSYNSPLSSLNIPTSSSSSSDHGHMSTSPSCLTAYGSMSASPSTHSSYTTSQLQSQ